MENNFLFYLAFLYDLLFCDLFQFYNYILKQLYLWILITGTNCTPPAIDDFPSDLFTRQQRQSGAVVFHIAVSLYLFLALAVVCDKYFVPAVEKICQGNLVKQTKKEEHKIHFTYLFYLLFSF